MNWLGTSTRRNVAASLAFLSALVILLIVIADFVSRFPDAGFARGLAPTPTETPTFVPTKFAIAVDSPTPTASNTPTLAPTPTSTPTRKPTQTASPSRAPTITPTAKRIAAPMTAPSPTAMLVSVGEKYDTLVVYPSPSDHSTAPVELNIAARGFAPGKGTLGLVNVDGPADAGAPQLYSLFADERTPTFSNVYQIYNWDWSCNCQGALLADPEISLVGLVVSPGEIIGVPRSSYYIGEDYQVLVLHADSERVTLNYTRTGNPSRGYTIYLEGLAVDSTLVALYQQTNAAGRVELPALQAGQGLGRARGGEIKVAIRDAGAFMDPRSRKDWWRK
ncbi:MAG: hypothetical protein KGJ80_12205 [Chloroflexota bacterium]|nr:hypothetical protein [Chloroflexota bacterium]